ncbi:PfkB domain protein [Chthoniobacter flavus Ellin428]|uniref:Ribokinase n=1 Tax=Chthoniobacter flavus Ellin428 TaxID=497964 RepID=B4D498_9BACT|nr:ribokinase [Chthoniobacter flavus]EDY18699.1 PfkB domain protein [Chthoniobacter flavus Ellin428]TCO89062.1 ribokinase [Chthoniobacter flavus]
MPKRPPPSSPRVVVIGGANTDFLVRAPRLPLPGETVNGEEFDHAEAGGKGANQAVAAARLGARVTFVGRVGADDRGRALLRRLAAEGIDGRDVVRDPRSHTGVALISVDAGGEKQILVSPGANQRLSAADVRRPAVARAIAGADVLILQFEVPLTASLAAARLAHRAGVPIVLDPAPALRNPPPNIAKQLTALLRTVTVLRANEHEAEALTGIRVTDGSTAQIAAEYLLTKFGLRATVIAAGQGNLAVWHESASAVRRPPSTVPLRTFYLPRLRVKAIDATGAGDAFAAALAVALAEGQPIPNAAHFANVTAALATTKLGAQPALPTRAAVLKFLRSAVTSE